MLGGNGSILTMIAQLNICEILEKMKSVFGNVLIGKKALAVLLLAKKTDFLKIKFSRCLEGSLIKNGKNI